MKNLILLLFGFLPTVSFADYIDTGTKQYYGKIIFLSNTKITLQENCNGVLKDFQWSNEVSVKFTEQCTHPGFELSTSPITADLKCVKKRVFQFGIKDKGECYADEMVIKDGTVRVIYSKGKGTKEIPALQLYKVIEWALYRDTCESDIPNNFSTF